jgi:hypothetical protein
MIQNKYYQISFKYIFVINFIKYTNATYIIILVKFKLSRLTQLLHYILVLCIEKVLGSLDSITKKLFKLVSLSYRANRVGLAYVLCSRSMV